MAMNVGQMLIKLSQDAELLAQFKESPKEVLDAHEVSEADQETILSGDQDRIAQAIGNEHAADNEYGFDAFI